MTSNWIEILLDGAPIKSIYGSDIPSLIQVDLHEVNICRDGPRVAIRFDLKNFPTNPPKKWLERKVNRVQLQISAFDVQTFEMNGISSNMLADVEMIKEGENLTLKIVGDNFKLVTNSKFMILDKISAYVNDD